MDKLKPCPCGKTPKTLMLTLTYHYIDNGQGAKWASAYCDQCGEWSIEFRTQYKKLDSEAAMRYAAEAWNDAPRADKPRESDDNKKALESDDASA